LLVVLAHICTSSTAMHHRIHCNGKSNVTTWVMLRLSDFIFSR
jgi:hypothetical protein